MAVFERGLEGVSKDDKVILCSNHGHRIAYTMQTVVHATKTQVHIGSSNVLGKSKAIKYRRVDGSPLSDSYHVRRTEVYPATEENLKQMAEIKAYDSKVNAVKNLKLNLRKRMETILNDRYTGQPDEQLEKLSKLEACLNELQFNE